MVDFSLQEAKKQTLNALYRPTKMPKIKKDDTNNIKTNGSIFNEVHIKVQAQPMNQST